MERNEARVISKDLKNVCIDRNGLCSKKDKCPRINDCKKYLGENQKPMNFDLVDIIDHIESKF